MLNALIKLALILALLVSSRAQVVDRIVAVVNKQVILQSELDDEQRIALLLDEKPLEEINNAGIDAALERLIDQALLKQQIVELSVVEPGLEEISSRIRDLRSRISGAATDDGWQAILNNYSVTQHDIELHIAAQLRILQFIDLRFRTLARVDRAAISDYYNQTLLPQLHKQGAPEPPLNQVSDRIQEILTEERINEQLNSWLLALRSQAHIEKMTPAAQAAAGAK